MKMTLTAGVAALLALAASAGLAEEVGQGASGSGTCTTQDQQPAALPPVSHTKTFQVVGR